MKYVGALFFLSALFARPAASAPQETVKFTPTVKIYECPPNFVYRSDCLAHEKKLDPQKLVLDIQVLNDRVGHWSLQVPDPVPASYYVIVVRGRNGNHYEYSVSAETGLPGSPAPFANERVEFSDSSPPISFGVSSATMEKDGKKYLTEIRLSEFHGKPVPMRAAPPSATTLAPVPAPAASATTLVPVPAPAASATTLAPVPARTK